MANDGKLFAEIQAALLNSECSPEYALERALLAVVQFAYVECGIGLEDLTDEAVRIWEENDLGSPGLGTNG